MTNILQPPPDDLTRPSAGPTRTAQPTTFQDIRLGSGGRARQPAASQQTVPLVPRRFTAPKTKEAIKRRRRLLLERLALIAAAPAVIIVSARLSPHPAIGEGLVAIYGVVALARRIPARISFWLASMALVSIGVEMLLLPGVSRPNNTALFVFLLLVVGLASSMFETRRLEAHGKQLRRR